MWIRGITVVGESLVELDKLVNSLVADERLANEKHEIRLVDLDQLGEGTHQRLVVLHTAGCVHEHDVEARVTSEANRLHGYAGGVLSVACKEEMRLDSFLCRVHNI